MVEFDPSVHLGDPNNPNALMEQIIEKQNVEEHFVVSVPLAVEVRPEDGEIVDVGPYKHSVIWKDEGRSRVRYCNNCGGVFSRRGKLKKEMDPQERSIVACAQCGIFQGFAEQNHEAASEAR